MTKKNTKRKKNKNGLRLLSKNFGLSEVFTGEKSKKQADDFATIFERKYSPESIKTAAKEKIAYHDPIAKAATELLKNYPTPQKEIDLHGFNATEAQNKTASFIQTARWHGLKTIRIITGKGLHSPGKAVLPEIVEGTVRDMKKRNQVLAFSWEKKSKEKSGALIVYLK